MRVGMTEFSGRLRLRHGIAFVVFVAVVFAWTHLAQAATSIFLICKRGAYCPMHVISFEPLQYRKYIDDRNYFVVGEAEYREHPGDSRYAVVSLDGQIFRNDSYILRGDWRDY